MKALAALFLMTLACFGQGRQNVIQTGVVDARGATWLPPKAWFATPPASPEVDSVYIFHDASATGVCTGGAGQTALATCKWTGVAWVAVGGGGGSASQTTLFSAGTKVTRQVECATGTVSYGSLTAASPSQEITIQTGIPVNTRWEQIQVSETTRFTGATGLTVSMGRPGSTNYEMTGTMVALNVSSGDTNFWTARPVPPAITGSAYNIVVNFATTSGNVNAVTAGVLTWEVCGYAAR